MEAYTHTKPFIGFQTEITQNEAIQAEPLKPQQNPTHALQRGGPSTRIETEFYPPSSSTAAKGNTSFELHVLGRSVFLQNNWRKGKLRGI
jgi:hypothetical protein